METLETRLARVEERVASLSRIVTWGGGIVSGSILLMLARLVSR